LANGILGIQATFDYYSWSGGVGSAGYSWKYIPIGVTANYHFKLDERKSIRSSVLVSAIRSSRATLRAFPTDTARTARIYFIGRAGARYFFSPKMAAYGDVGAGGATLNLGIMFKLN
jgi:hypothetical protein